MEWIFMGITAAIALIALSNWRLALYAYLVLDVLRDPVRKLTEQQSSITTVVVGIVWLTALVGAVNGEPREVRLLFRRYRSLRTSLVLLVLALLPGMVVSLVQYDNGWLLAMIGGASYAAPFIGVLLGYLWPRRASDIYRWMMAYSLINAVFLIGAVMEACQFDFPALGGLRMKWVRNYGTDLIPLICGFYRSPDIMGLHAAHVIMFSVLLAIRPRQRFAWLWLAIGGWSSIALILCGRRKMIVIPIICLVTYVALMAIFTGRKRIAIALAILLGVGIVSLQSVSDGFVADNEYARFATSIASEGVERASRSFTDIIFTTVRQSGWLGDGLGTVTQGRQYLGVVTSGKDWQEDGVGRLFKELGIPGVVSIIGAGFLLLRAVRTSIGAIPIGHPLGKLQFGFCGIVAANVASFSVSHQAYSGDPSAVLIVGFCVGVIMGLPRPVWAGTTGTAMDIPQEPTENLPMEPVDEMLNATPALRHQV